jgi:hypothetical protein
MDQFAGPRVIAAAHAIALLVRHADDRGTAETLMAEDLDRCRPPARDRVDAT